MLILRIASLEAIAGATAAPRAAMRSLVAACGNNDKLVRLEVSLMQVCVPRRPAGALGARLT